MNAGMKRILAVLSVISCSAAAILSPAEHVLAQDYTAGTSPTDADISGQQPYTPVPENPAWQLPVNETISGGQESADGSYLVQRSTSRDGKYKTIARLASGKSNTDQTVTGAKHFYYRIAAKAESGKLYYSRSYPFQCPLEPLPG